MQRRRRYQQGVRSSGFVFVACVGQPEVATTPNEERGLGRVGRAFLAAVSPPANPRCRCCPCCCSLFRCRLASVSVGFGVVLDTGLSPAAGCERERRSASTPERASHDGRQQSGDEVRASRGRGGGGLLVHSLRCPGSAPFGVVGRGKACDD